VTHFVYTPLVIPLVISAVACAALLPVAWRNRVEPVAPWFAATLVALLVWTVAYALELMAVGLEEKVLWANTQFVATVVTPLAWLQVALIFAGRKGLSRKAWLVLSTLAAAVLVGVFLNPHELFRVAPAIVTHETFSALRPNYGPIWTFAWIPFVYGLFVAAMLLAMQEALRARGPRAKQAAAMFGSTVLPLAAGTAYVFGLFPIPDYNPAMAVVGISAILVAYALFSSRVLELAPLTRDAILEHLTDGVIILDRHGRIVDSNSAAAAALPELTHNEVGRPTTDVFAHRPDVLSAVRQATTTDSQEDRQDVVGDVETREIEVSGEPTSPGGTARVLSLRLTPVLSGTRTQVGLAIVVRDVTERAEQLDEAVNLAATDALTGAFTRRRFMELAEVETSRASRSDASTTLLMLDVDHFKRVNDTCGHSIGDRVLGSVAAATRASLRDGDLIGRIGGDEFCVLLPGTGSHDGRLVAERLRCAISERAQQGADLPWRPTVSVGLATTTDAATDGLTGLLEAADKALYEAKTSGRDRVAGVSGLLPPVADAQQRNRKVGDGAASHVCATPGHAD
jgi:diguanylate cyclase (GGDEF)-like protein/PAS domain S-box-containing protein